MSLVDRNVNNMDGIIIFKAFFSGMKGNLISNHLPI